MEPSAMGNGGASAPGGERMVPVERATQRVVLTIAGLDPSSGAGLTADLKVFAAHGVYGVAAATALTVQSTVGVRRVEAVSARLLTDTLACLVEDLPLAGIKIGMLATGENVGAIVAFLGSLSPNARKRQVPIVLDPVLCSTSGHSLLDQGGVMRLRDDLLPLVTCITPNLEELLLLSGDAMKDAALGSDERGRVVEAAALLAYRHPGLGVVVTGGHLDVPDDYVLAPGLPGTWLRGSRVETAATHGTGCAYSSALLCRLVEGLTLSDAAHAAKQYVTEALRAAKPMGKGGGSMHHLYTVFPSL